MKTRRLRAAAAPRLRVSVLSRTSRSAAPLLAECGRLAVEALRRYPTKWDHQPLTNASTKCWMETIVAAQAGAFKGGYTRRLQASAAACRTFPRLAGKPASVACAVANAVNHTTAHRLCGWGYSTWRRTRLTASPLDSKIPSRPSSTARNRAKPIGVTSPYPIVANVRPEK